MNYFEALEAINLSDKVEEKNGLNYISWASAWSELKKKYPKSYATTYENAQGWHYHTDGRTAWVKMGVTVVFDDGSTLEHIDTLPIMDFRNKSIPLERITSFDVNTAKQRCIAKCCALHGVGIAVYRGEDIKALDYCGSEKPAKTKTEKKDFGKMVAEAEGWTYSDRPTKEQMDELAALGVNDLKGVAKWLKKDEDELTAEDVQKAIEKKKEELG